MNWAAYLWLALMIGFVIAEAAPAEAAADGAKAE